MSSFQDYSQPIISNFDFDVYMEIAKKVFDPQWQFLGALRSIDRTNDDPGLTAYKERQVFVQLLTLQRVANYKDLCHWALVQTTAHYAHGVRAIVVDSSRFDGHTCSTA